MTYKPVIVTGAERSGRWVVTCDHATNRVPDAVNGGTLGLPEADMQRHIAYDIGGQGVALRLAERLNGPAVCADFSRLVIDPNRGVDDPTLLMKLYDGTIIPGNRHADEAEIAARRALCYDPYHDALARTLARRPDSVLCSIHSFTPKLNGRPKRPWEIGVLHARTGTELAQALLEDLRRETDLTVGENEPYGGHLPGDAIDRHALGPGRPNVLIELRQDLIARPEDQIAWADLLVAPLERALSATGL